MGARHFVDVGFIFDIAMVVVIGVAVLKAFEMLWDIYKIIPGALTPTELIRAAAPTKWKFYLESGRKLIRLLAFKALLMSASFLCHNKNMSFCTEMKATKIEKFA